MHVMPSKKLFSERLWEEVRKTCLMHTVPSEMPVELHVRLSGCTREDPFSDNGLRLSSCFGQLFSDQLLSVRMCPLSGERSGGRRSACMSV